MSETDVVTTDYVLAGYRVVTPAEVAWDGPSLPGRLVSMSDCLVDLAAVDDAGWDYWFADPASARQARAGAGPARSAVLRVGLPAQNVPDLLADMSDRWNEAGNLVANLRRREPVHVAEPLGFEVVGFDEGLWHTWACLGDLVGDVRRATGVEPGQWGLIQDEQDARQAAEWLTESGLGDSKVFYWTPAMLSADRDSRHAWAGATGTSI